MPTVGSLTSLRFLIHGRRVPSATSCATTWPPSTAVVPVGVEQRRRLRVHRASPRRPADAGRCAPGRVPCSAVEGIDRVDEFLRRLQAEWCPAHAQGVRSGRAPARVRPLQRRRCPRRDPVHGRSRPRATRRRLPARPPCRWATTSSTPRRWRCWPTGSAYRRGWWWGPLCPRTARSVARTCTRGSSSGWPTAAGGCCRPRSSWAASRRGADLTPAPQPQLPATVVPEPPGAADPAGDPAARQQEQQRVQAEQAQPGAPGAALAGAARSSRSWCRWPSWYAAGGAARAAGPRTGWPAPGGSSSTTRVTSGMPVCANAVPARAGAGTARGDPELSGREGDDGVFAAGRARGAVVTAYWEQVDGGAAASCAEGHARCRRRLWAPFNPVTLVRRRGARPRSINACAPLFA